MIFRLTEISSNPTISTTYSNSTISSTSTSTSTLASTSAAASAVDSVKTANVINNGGNFYFTVIIYLIVFAAIIACFVLLRKYLTKRLGTIKNGTYMKIIDRIVIAQDKQIILIEMKNRILVVGITQQRMETLAEIEKTGESDENFRLANMSAILNTESDNNINNKIDNKNNGFFNLLNEKIKTGFDKLNDREKK